MVIFRCKGRFEIYFNPQHPKQITPGWPKGERYCIVIGEWVDESHPEGIDFYLYFGWLISCKATLYLTRIVMFGLPEMFLYYTTFRHILKHNQKTALSGIISQDTVKRRKQQNKLNIMITFWAWLAQLVTNIVYLLLMLIFFGKARYYHVLLAICTICLNFNILPLFYIVMADDEFKKVVNQTNIFLALFELFFGNFRCVKL